VPDAESPVHDHRLRRRIRRSEYLSSEVDAYSSFVKRVTVVVVLVIAYAWWDTGVAPFTSLSYSLIAVPSIVAVALYASRGAFARHRTDITNYYRSRTRHVSLSSIAPWLVVLLGAATLEVVGLALGGQSTSVPTLSTTVDHLLERHWERCVLYTAWLLMGAGPLWRLWRRQQKIRA
jgi:hypothetical protein